MGSFHVSFRINLCEWSLARWINRSEIMPRKTSGRWRVENEGQVEMLITTPKVLCREVMNEIWRAGGEKFKSCEARHFMRDPFTRIRYKFCNHRWKSMPWAWNVLFINFRLSRPLRSIEYEIGTEQGLKWKDKKAIFHRFELLLEPDISANRIHK